MFRSLLIVSILAMSACVMAEDEARTITVSGNGSAEVEPDRAMLSMSISVQKKTLAAAQQGVADVTNKVLAMTDQFKIDRSQVDTTGATVRPDYRWNRDTEQQVFLGYTATRQITIEIADFERLGEIMEAAVATGVNNVSPPQLDSSKRRETYRQALARAADDARDNAQQLAASFGGKLGKALQVSSGSVRPAPMQNVRALGLADSEAAGSYNAADLTFNANVNVTFELLD